MNYLAVFTRQELAEIINEKTNLQAKINNSRIELIETNSYTSIEIEINPLIIVESSDFGIIHFSNEHFFVYIYENRYSFYMF
ncbi:MAG: hypothetical protein K9J21_06885 [Bacteroidales bacterium]|nr:hypothetical protein [Bacteroidales bacterium]